MNKLDPTFATHHLAIKVFSVLPGEEWEPKSSGWSLIQIENGSGYWLRARSTIELDAGTVVLAAGGGQGRIHASQLSGLSLRSFNVNPARINGLMTLGEQDFLKQASLQRDLALQVFPSHSPIAGKMRELRAKQTQGGFLFRLMLLQLFVEVFGNEFEQFTPSQENADAKERLQVFLKENPLDALLDISFNELAQLTHCTPRHLSRIFYDLAGMSFRDKRAEIRLSRARELLATSQSKVVEVAFESGYKSLSLFNLMFTRRYGTSPGKWRQKHAVNGGNANPPSRGARRFAIS